MEFKPEQRASLITLPASDLPAATAFYRDGLGWHPTFSNDEVTFFQLNGLVLGLWLRSHMSKALGIPADQLGPGGMEVAHNVRAKDHVDAFLELVQAGGGRLVAPAKDTEWGGPSGHIADLDGHRWEIAWNPAWEISADGGTTIPEG